MMYERRLMLRGLAAALVVGIAPTRQALAQYYAQPGYPPPPPGYPDPRYEDHRREEYEGRGGPYQGGVAAIQRERNRRVLDLQLQLRHGQIGRRQFNDEVAQIDREMNAQIYGR